MRLAKQQPETAFAGHCYSYDGRGNWRFESTGTKYCTGTCTFYGTGELVVGEPLTLPDGSQTRELSATISEPIRMIREMFTQGSCRAETQPRPRQRSTGRSGISQSRLSEMPRSFCKPTNSAKNLPNEKSFSGADIRAAVDLCLWARSRVRRKRDYWPSSLGVVGRNRQWRAADLSRAHRPWRFWDRRNRGTSAGGMFIADGIGLCGMFVECL